MRKVSLGFTLVELAVVLIVLGLLLGGLLMPLSTQLDISRIRQTNDALDKVHEALLGYAIANNNRLPCPDTKKDDDIDKGLEDVACLPDVEEGDLPWRTLGVGRYDAWGRTFRYRPDDAYVASTGIGYPPNTTSGLQVQARPVGSAAPVALTAPNPNAPAAIIYSTGKNVVADVENETPLDGIYTQDVYVEDTFDDILIWVSKNTLVSRLAAAGTWPP